jgi:single-stranded-DNA-specific exonuclease
MTNRWVVKPEPDPHQVKMLAAELGVDRLVANLLVQRDIRTFDEAKAFFRPTLENLHDPFLMQDMAAAVDRVEEAISKGERILVFGDYDVDGTTSVALMAGYLRTRTTHVATYIPDRYTEGYGLSLMGIDFAYDNEITLIIALDCGVKAIDQVDYAAEKGIDIIICDHHRPGTSLPKAIAVLDPKREDCAYPYKELCGCGVGFKLIQGIEVRRGQHIRHLLPYFDLLALAIGADIVPITGENRILAYFGLKVINQGPRPGIRALLQGLKRDEYQITNLVFHLAPRINAAGRMQHGDEAVALLTEVDFDRALEKAEKIELLNTERRETDKTITEEALKLILEYGEEDNFSTVLYNEKWHKGVIGIVASRLIETYYRPTVVFTKSGDFLTASARSIRGFDIHEALEACSDCLVQFGGHTYAAGLTLHPNRLDEFKLRFEQYVAEKVSKDMLVPEIRIDREVHFKELTPKLFRILKQFSPFGPGNQIPIFLANEVRDSGIARKVGSDGAHLKMALVQENEGPLDAIAFGMGESMALIQNKNVVQLAFSLEENTWQGETKLQLKVKDIKAAMV